MMKDEIQPVVALVSTDQPTKRNRWLPENMHPAYFLLTPGTIALVSGLAAAVLLSLGVWTYVANSVLNEVSVEYTQCKALAPQLVTLA
jgi:hypothetical protein